MSWWTDQDVEDIINEQANADDSSEASASYCAQVTGSSNSELVRSWNQAFSDSTDMDDDD